MKKLKLYVETTVWNFLFSKTDHEKRSWTKLLFEEYENGLFYFYISQIVLEEIRRAEPTRRDQLEDAIRKYQPVILWSNDEAVALVGKYLNARFIPERYIDDLNHLAIASIHDMDVLVSWNLRHIVKLRTKTFVNSINMTEGYKSIEILTPQEVVDYDEGTESRERDP